MQLARQRETTTQPKIIAYALRALLILFALAVSASFAYALVVKYTSSTLEPAFFIPALVVTVSFILGWLIDRNHPGHRVALLFLVMAYATAVGIVLEGTAAVYETHPALISPTTLAIFLTLGHTMWIPGIYIPLFLMPLFFPTGKLLSPRWRPLVVLLVVTMVWTAVAIVLRPWPWPAMDIPDMRALNGLAGSEPFFDATMKVQNLLSAPLFFLVVFAGFLRYRRSQGKERVQMKWPILAIILLLAVSTVIRLVPELQQLDIESSYFLTWAMAMMIPISIAIAILHHGLWDIDIAIRRTLIYGILSAAIIALYIAIVGVLSLLFQTQSNTLSGLIAAAIIAVLFQPLRNTLQKQVNRLMFGERDDPAAVLTRLAHDAQKAETPQAILPNLVQTIAHTLKIPYAAIWLPADGGRMEAAAVWGQAPQNQQTLPLTYQQQIIGHLVVAPRGPHEQFDQHEQDLLANIAAITSSTVRAVQLSNELRLSRQQIVSAREDERRRLRRDLHDGLGPQLASQTLGLEAVSQLMADQPLKAQALLDSLKEQAEEATTDVRRLVYDLRPPALDDLGLVSALRQRALSYESSGLHFEFDTPAALPELPAAVETAVYRIALEAMTNVVRHAGATICTVRLACAGGKLVVEIEDNGRGLPADLQAGVGLQAMQERTSELNGQLTLQSLPGGALVRAAFPLEDCGE